MTPALTDWRALLSGMDRAEFAMSYDHPFLLALLGVAAPPGPTRTVRLEGGPGLVAALKAERRRLAGESDRLPAILPVKKTQASFPSMITVGRARNNDIVVSDVLVSKFHAFFRHAEAGWTVSDAGSANGTKVGEHQLVAKGPPVPVRLGDRVTFGVSAFVFVDAAGLWTAVRESAAVK